MAVTLLGNGPEWHDRLAGRAGSFAEAEAQLPTADEVIVSARRANAFHVGAIVEYACNRLGVDSNIAPFDPHPPLYHASPATIEYPRRPDLPPFDSGCCRDRISCRKPSPVYHRLG